MITSAPHSPLHCLTLRSETTSRYLWPVTDPLFQTHKSNFAVEDIFPLAHTHRPTPNLELLRAAQSKTFYRTRAIFKIECSGCIKPSPSRDVLESKPLSFLERFRSGAGPSTLPRHLLSLLAHVSGACRLSLPTASGSVESLCSESLSSTSP
ncbi:hypothetical protein NPIL_677861 [Nephila pilipes]|uniref:Uncharacterized protein n=1 Tax=Nephila pilipes TaxID=299642 RepID=A0A8X6PG42_NEPPI|nr:hypothetical protein NPIL_677861 [Nephila pilipes]